MARDQPDSISDKTPLFGTRPHIKREREKKEAAEKGHDKT